MLACFLLCALGFVWEAAWAAASFAPAAWSLIRCSKQTYAHGCSPRAPSFTLLWGDLLEFPQPTHSPQRLPMRLTDEPDCGSNSDSPRANPMVVVGHFQELITNWLWPGLCFNGTCEYCSFSEQPPTCPCSFIQGISVGGLCSLSSIFSSLPCLCLSIAEQTGWFLLCLLII